MPPRTRTQTTAPAGRRPKVAGLRAPGKPGVTAESPRPSGPHDDEADEPDTALADSAASTDTAAPVVDDTDAPDDAGSDRTDDADGDDAGSSTTDAPAADRPASDPKASGAKASGVKAPDAKVSGAKAPSSKSARAQREATAPSGSRSPTALLDRPEPERRPREPKQAPKPSSPRRQRFAGLVAPFRRLADRPGALQGVLGAIIVVCLVLGGLAFWQGHQEWTQGPVSNGAVVDVGGTAEVVGQTRQAMEQILSYDFTKLDDSVNAAKTQSTGAFTSQYLQVFEQTIRGPAQQQKLRQTASVLNIGVQQLSGDHATLMALVQFTAERTTNQQTTNAPGLLTVQVVREDGRWKISELKPM